MKIYTRTGDKGTTALFGADRVSKTHPRIRAYGTIDEVNSLVGLARAHLPSSDHVATVRRILLDVQSDLFVLGADLATPSGSKAEVPRVTSDHITNLERDIDRLEEDLEDLRQFILPGGSPAAASLHASRTVCRRAERLVLEAAEEEEISAEAAVYLNRLSDLLFVAARWTNKMEGRKETTWPPKQ